MLEFDHVAITVSDLDETINFYKKLGYKLQSEFDDEDYRWATLSLFDTSLEIFESSKNDKPKIDHIAYSFANESDVSTLYNPKDNDIFYGDLNRKSFFIEDNSGISIQFIKKR